MKILSAVLFAFVIFSCGSGNATIEAESNENSGNEVIDTIETEAARQFTYPEALVTDACLPYPKEEFFYFLEHDSLYVMYGNHHNRLYNYTVAHFDSLEEKIHFEMEDEYDMGKYSWQQHFSNGIWYEEIFWGEGGPTATLHTNCSTKLAVVSTINVLVNYQVNEESNPDDGVWNEDSTEFGPFEFGAGCFYSILKDDSTGFYKVENYCGC